MIQSKKWLIIVLMIPILILAGLVAYKKILLSTGKEVTLPISGYDPRDMLSGYYLVYQIEYGAKNLCPERNNRRVAFICLDNKTFSYEKPSDCKIFLRGVCQYGRFMAGIERFYIPENMGKELTAKIRNKKASIVLSIIPNGYAQVKNLLIGGVSWEQAVVQDEKNK